MFTSLKNKIKEETGNDVTATPSMQVNQSRRLSTQRSNSLSTNASSSTAGGGLSASFGMNGMSLASTFDELHTAVEQKDTEINALTIQLNEVNDKYAALLSDYEKVMADKDRLEKSNEILDEAVKVAQVQKELIYNEQDKIQNIQLQEISKLKSLLHFREQEAVDRQATIKQKDNQLEQLQGENKRLREMEDNFEDIQDGLEKLRHSTQLEKNNLTASFAAVEEQNRHLTSKLQIYEEARVNFTINQSKDEKVQSLLRERKMLEQRLEEAHLHLADIKGTWSAQNLALETQVDRLSRQVAAETTEKRKALKIQDEFAERMKQTAFELEKAQNEVEQRDQKIKLLSEEIDDLSSTLREFKDENEEEVTFLRNKVEKSTQELADLKQRLEDSTERLNCQTDDSDRMIRSLNARIDALQQEVNDVRNLLENEKQEKNTALLKNAEISQSEERLKQELRNESHELSEVYEQLQKVQTTLQTKTKEIDGLNLSVTELHGTIQNQEDQIQAIEEMKIDIIDKNKTIKMLNQRLSDVKKTLQNELKINTANSKPMSATTTLINRIDTEKLTDRTRSESAVVMDDVNFKYLKHVILKFLTSREVEARHLIRAIGTLLQLNADEEQLLHDTLNFKVSWFGTRQSDVLTRTRHQRLFSISTSPTS